MQPKATTPQRIFSQTNLITQPEAYEGGFFFKGGGGGGGGRGHHATICMSEWQQGITSSTSSTSSSTSFWATSPSTRFRSNQRGGVGVIWAWP